MGSSDEGKFAGFNVRGRTGEVYAGVRKAFGNDTVRPYLGGGLSIIRGEVDAAGSDDSDTSAAAYLHAGVEFLISPTFFLGLDIRGLFGSSIDMGGVNGDADYTQGAFTFGWRF
jgi:opacity protein-like surface antigen